MMTKPVQGNQDFSALRILYLLNALLSALFVFLFSFDVNKAAIFNLASLYLIFYHPLFIMFVWSYYKAVSTDPGSPVEARTAKATPLPCP